MWQHAQFLLVALIALQPARRLTLGWLDQICQSVERDPGSLPAAQAISATLFYAHPTLSTVIRISLDAIAVTFLPDMDSQNPPLPPKGATRAVGFVDITMGAGQDARTFIYLIKGICFVCNACY
ncbi:hypothetical protein [Brucella sp. NBRC 12953]|uniref:hypothetical protein n=1 Tax=Brucella sp. NBRC 12953 TaxID=3075481 RepID=UPI0013B04809